jgi:hypothetical protein
MCLEFGHQLSMVNAQCLLAFTSRRRCLGCYLLLLMLLSLALYVVLSAGGDRTRRTVVKRAAQYFYSC